MSVETIQLASAETGAEAPIETSRPEGVPEKFWDETTKSVNTEAILKSYNELERRLGNSNLPPEEQSGESPDAPTNETNNQPSEEQALSIAQNAGINVEELQDYFSEHGEISEEHYAKLEEKGISRPLVDEFIRHRVAEVENVRQNIFKSVGGEKAYDSLVRWAVDHWSHDKIQAFNDVLDTNSPEQWKLAVSGLKADYEKANGVRPNLLKPTSSSPSTGGRYESFEQMRRDMANPLYEKDPAFREAVRRKLENSNI